jgi:hypothetical protein
MLAVETASLETSITSFQKKEQRKQEPRKDETLTTRETLPTKLRDKMRAIERTEKGLPEAEYERKAERTKIKKDDCAFR